MVRARRRAYASLLNVLAGPSWPFLASMSYLAAITAAEMLVAVGDPRLGVPLHVCVLLVLLLHGARSAYREQCLYWALTLGPLIRIMSLSLPLGQVPFIWWYAVISVPLFLGAAVTVRLLGYSAADVGLRLRWTDVPLHLGVALVGVPLGVMEYLILRPTPLIAELTLGAVWLPALILLVSTGFMEELIFRGLLQRAASVALGGVSGPLLATALFAVLHIGYKSWVDLVFVFFAGGIFAILAARSDSIWGVTLAHGVVNTLLFLICPFFLGGAR